MRERDSVLVDSSVWIHFLDGEARAVQLLARAKDASRVVISGQVKQEVLQSARDTHALAKLDHDMSVWDYEAEQPADFVEAARIYAGLRWNGITIPAADCLIAAVAKRCGYRVCATDPHFDKIPGLRRFSI
jgi:predicted nucleic acid-binding protein